MNNLERWIKIALTNLSIVALLGLTLRSKMIFSLPFITFQYVLHAHSHFAFGGWVTIALLALMTFRIIKPEGSKRRLYNIIISIILLNAYGMLFSFPLQGYAFYSILFSSLFIFSTYFYTIIFLRDLKKVNASKSVKLLSGASVFYLALSSIGAFTLAYLMATRSKDVYFYKDAVYTYLHLQYSGFFSLAVMALMLQYAQVENKATRAFSRILNITVIPAMFMSYLWHYPHNAIRTIAYLGSFLTLCSLVSFLIMMASLKPHLEHIQPIVKRIAFIATVAFGLKMFFQTLTIIPALGPLVFANRPVIIGFLHLVLLGFVTLYLLAYFIQINLISPKGASGAAITVFIVGVLLNEVVLFMQGLGFMFMLSSGIVNWLLLTAAILLFTGALTVSFIRWFKRPTKLLHS
ncbi:MAG: hypothetical protein JSS78_05380 [Bacteroidetes bacterium]|nr:hypothetical protein [Bacteroidota bacterium]